MTETPCASALVLSFERNPPNALSDNAFANFLFFSRFVTFSVSIPIVDAFLTISVVALWCASLRIQAIR